MHKFDIGEVLITPSINLQVTHGSLGIPNLGFPIFLFPSILKGELYNKFGNCVFHFWFSL